MSLDSRPDETLLDSARRQHEDDLAQRHQEWLVQEACESSDAAEAFWAGAFRGSAKHYSSSQTWDGHRDPGDAA